LLNADITVAQKTKTILSGEEHGRTWRPPPPPPIN